MKKTLITFIAVLLSLAGAHAQSKHVQTHLWQLDSLTLDSMYNHWYTYAQEHPQDEVAWRNVYDVYKNYEHYLIDEIKEASADRLPKARKEMLQKMGFMEKMKQTIPDSYTYNICTFDIAHDYVHPTDNSYDVYLDRVIEKLPDYDDGYDYDPLVSIFVERDDSVRLKKVLDLYFQSGFYPSEELQYNYNELQGMEEGAKNGLILRRLMLPAACIIGFAMGYGLRPTSESNTATLPQQTLIQRDTVLLTQTVRDTIYQTRIVTRQVPVQHLAVNTSAEEENTATSDETKSCSMLCDDIRYDMLAQSH